MLTAIACAAANPVVGKWTCTNLSDTGTQSPWTLMVREDGKKLAGLLTDGEAEIPLSEMKLDAGDFTFRFHINAKPYRFEGKVEGKKLEGNYSGEEATGKLRCEKPR